GQGVKVSYWQRADVPLTDIRWVFNGGSAKDADLKLGTATLAAEMLTRGAEGQNGSQFETTLSLAGASLDASAGVRTTTVHLTTLTESLPLSLKLAVSAMKAPGMLSTEWDSAQRERLAAIEAQSDDPSRVGALVANREYYGGSHPAGRPAQGTLDTVKKITLDDVKAQAAAVVNPAGMRIFAAGSLSPTEFQQHLQATLAGWEPKGSTSPMVALGKPAMEDGALKVVLVDRPGASQTVIRLIEPGVNLASSDRLALASLGRIMGGSFTSRLNQNLRENKGYTYGAGSSFDFDKEYGTFSVRTSVRTDVTGASLTEILKELKGVAVGNVTTAEAGKSASVGRSDQIEALSSIEGIVATAAGLYQFDRKLADLGADLAGSQKVTDADLNKLAPRLGRLDHGVLVLVGDKSKILPQLKGLGLPEPVITNP
ncbi:MAG: pitrilysin family protein, partial [bacterium]